VPLGLAELGGQKSLGEVPGDGRPHRPAAHAEDVHVVVLDPLLGGEMVVHQRGAHAWHLIGADRGAHAAAADRHAAIHLPGRHGPGQGDHEVGIVVARIEAMGAEIDHLVPRPANAGGQFLFQCEAAVIGGNAHAHVARSM